jgi:hypothetical protein
MNIVSKFRAIYKTHCIHTRFQTFWSVFWRMVVYSYSIGRSLLSSTRRQRRGKVTGLFSWTFSIVCFPLSTVWITSDEHNAIVEWYELSIIHTIKFFRILRSYSVKHRRFGSTYRFLFPGFITSSSSSSSSSSNSNNNNVQGKRGKIRPKKKHWYQHVSKSAEGKVTTLWNKQVQTDRTISSSKPDIIIRDNEKRNICTNRCCNFWRQKCDEERSWEHWVLRKIFGPEREDVSRRLEIKVPSVATNTVLLSLSVWQISYKMFQPK